MNFLAKVYVTKNIIISCEDFEGFHHDDIETVIGTDKETARRAVKELFPWMYIEEYRKEVDLL